MQITRTWSAVDIDRLKKNYDALKHCRDNGMEIQKIVSANAYSFEAMTQGPMQGICPQYLAVKSIEDGVCLRAEGVTLPILVLSYPYPDDVVNYVKTLHRNFLAQSLDSPAVCRAIANRTIPAYGGVICSHIKVQIGENTGDGYSCADGESPIDDLVSAKSNLGLYCEGIYTELSREDSEEDRIAKVKALHKIAHRLESITGKPFALKHVFLK